MKEIPNNTYTDIEDLIHAKNLAIADAAIEKDFHVTDALGALASIQNDHFDLVFCGGTCLSKAHGLVQRFSEDVDIKVVSKNSDVPATKASIKKNLSLLKSDVRAALTKAGFEISDADVEARNGNSYIEMKLGYSSKFTPSDQLREFVKLELVHTDLLRPFAPKPIPLLFDTLAGVNSPKHAINCIDPRETLAEKLISFPRRFGMHLEGVGREFDPTLVRHLYDVNQIINHAPEIIQDKANLADLFSKIVAIDSAQFINQDPKFSENPISVMRNALNSAKNSEEMRSNYDSFMNDLVYAEAEKRPSFAQALDGFQELFESLVQERQKENNLEAMVSKIASPGLASGQSIDEHLKDRSQIKHRHIKDDPSPT